MLGQMPLLLRLLDNIALLDMLLAFFQAVTGTCACVYMCFFFLPICSTMLESCHAAMLTACLLRGPAASCPHTQARKADAQSIPFLPTALLHAHKQNTHTRQRWRLVPTCAEPCWALGRHKRAPPPAAGAVWRQQQPQGWGTRVCAQRHLHQVGGWVRRGWLCAVNAVLSGVEPRLPEGGVNWQAAQQGFGQWRQRYRCAENLLPLQLMCMLAFVPQTALTRTTTHTHTHTPCA